MTNSTPLPHVFKWGNAKSASVPHALRRGYARTHENGRRAMEKLITIVLIILALALLAWGTRQ